MTEDAQKRKYLPPRIQGADGIRLCLQFAIVVSHSYYPGVLTSWFTPGGADVGSFVVGVFFVLSGYTTYSSIASLDLSSPTPLRLIQIWVEFLAKRMIPIYILVRLLSLVSVYVHGPKGQLRDELSFFYDWGVPSTSFQNMSHYSGPLWYLGHQFFFWIIGPPIILVTLLPTSKVLNMFWTRRYGKTWAGSIIPAIVPMTLLLGVGMRLIVTYIQFPSFLLGRFKIQNRVLAYLLGIGTAQLADILFRCRYEPESESDLDLALPKGQTNKQYASTNLGPFPAKSTAQAVLRKLCAFVLSGGWIVEIAVVISFFGFNIRSSQNWVTFIGPIFPCFCLFCLSTPGARSSTFAQITNSRVAARTCSGSIALTAYVIHALVLGFDVGRFRVAKKMSPPAGLIWLFTISILCDRYLVDVSRKFVNSVLRHLGPAVKWAGSQEERVLLTCSFLSKKCREIICLARFQIPLESASDLVSPTSSYEVVKLPRHDL